MKSQISSREDVEEILRGLEERLAEPVQVLIIGGAAMLELGLKDVFILKLIANRPKDIEDCLSLTSAKMDYEAMYAEIEAQYAKEGTVEEKIWITYLEEGIGKLEEDYRLQLPIADRISELADGYRERLFRKLTG